MKEIGVDSRGIDIERVNVGVAEYRVAEDVDLSTSGLGSCLAVVLYEEASSVAGLGHFMLPSKPDGSEDDAAKFVDTGIHAMIEEMERFGVEQSNVLAKMAGGSALLPNPTNDKPIGPQNVDEAQQILEELRVPILGMDVGEDYGRSVEFDPTTSTMTVDGAHTETVQF